MIPYGKQYITDSDIQAVTSVLQSDWITQGAKVQEFENKLCEITGAKYAVAVNNGTAALHAALLALQLPHKTEIITTPNTFLSTSNVIEMTNHIPTFIDIDEKTGNLSPASLKTAITPDTGCIIPVHFSGIPCNMSEISSLAKQNNCAIIEDAAHAIGSTYKGTKIGSCTYSDMTTFSFHPVKTITTGEGGAITTNNKLYYDRLCSLRNHGIVRDSSKFTNTSPGPWYYEMHTLGYNYRITDFQCNLGINQLKQLDLFKEKRHLIMTQYKEAFSNNPYMSMLHAPDYMDPCYHLAVILIDFPKINKTRSDVMTELLTKGIGTQVHYIPVPSQPYYKNKYGYSPSSLPNTEHYYAKTLSLPLFPKLSNKDVKTVISSIKDICRP